MLREIKEHGKKLIEQLKSLTTETQEKENISETTNLENSVNCHNSATTEMTESAENKDKINIDSSATSKLSVEHDVDIDRFDLCLELLSLLKIHMNMVNTEINARLARKEAQSFLTGGCDLSLTPTATTPIPSTPTPHTSSVDVQMPSNSNTEVTEYENVPFNIVEEAPTSHHYYQTPFQPDDRKAFLKAVRREHKLLEESLPPGVWVR